MSQDFARVGAAAAQVPGSAGAVVTQPDGELLYALRPDESFPAASVIKLPLVMALHAEAAAGRLELAERVGPGAPAEGTGVLRDLRDVGPLSLRDLAALAIAVSDNTATNRLIERLGMDTVNGWLDAWDCPRTRLRRRMYDLDAAARGLENVVTPREAAALLRRLLAGECGGRAASDAVLALLERCQDGSLLGRFLPDGTRLAHKTGTLARSRNDAGIVFGERPVVAVGLVRETGEVGRAADWLGLLGVVALRLAGGEVALPWAFGA